MSKYLITSIDLPVLQGHLFLVEASSAEEALLIYQRAVGSKETHFREWVLDLSANMSFAETFYITTELEKSRLENEWVVGTEPEIVRSRIQKYFSSQPAIGEKYLSYMENKDRTLITDDVFEFVALKQTDPQEHGMVALDLSKIQNIQ